MPTQTQVKFNAVVFEEKIHQELAQRVKGYSVVIANESDIQAKVSSGWAQAPGDGNVPMKTFISSGIGSVSKVLTAVALLHLFDRHKLSSASVQEQLDMSIWDKLPLKWRETTLAGKNFEKVTYRSLLQHKSGIASDGIEPPKEYSDNGIGFYFILQKGVDENKIGERDYNNYAMVLVGLLVAAIAYPEQVAKFHQEHKNLDHFEYTKALRLEYLRLYEKYMREEIFSQAFESIAPTCRPERELPDDKYAKGYANRDDKTGSSPQRKDPCNPQGGWFLSAQELAQFARTLAFSNRYIGPTTRASLYDPTNIQTRDERMVYSSLIGQSGFEKEFEEELGQKDLRWAYHDGSVSGYRAIFMKLPYDYYGVITVNSGVAVSSDEDGETVFLAQLLIDSFYEATRNQPISLAKHGISEGKYQQYVSELAEHGSMPDWINFYNVGDEVFVNVIFLPSKTTWLARHGLTSKEYQDLYDEHVENGSYKLKQVDSYVKSGQIRYAVILVKGDSTNMPAYHGITADEHQKKIDTLTAQGFVPVNLSVTSIDGQRRYAVFYEKKTVGGLAVKSFLTGEQYQTFVDEQVEAKREIAYLKSYNHNGDIRYSAIFYGNINRLQILKHEMSSSGYQREFDRWVGQEGYALTMVTAAAKDRNHVFAAVWQK
jgi:CubicO group peptidase (beta-lactamase class C family)